MLDKQTAIELAEGLGYTPEIKSDYQGWYELPNGAYMNPQEYFTFERMALLELEYNMIVGCNSGKITAWAEGASWAHIPHDGTIEGKMAARMQAVAKVLIDIKRGEE